MFNPNFDFVSIVAGASIFLLVASLWFIAVVIWRARVRAREAHIQSRLESRFGSAPTDDARVLKLWRDGKVNTIRVQSGGAKRTFSHFFDHMRQAFGWTMPLGTFVMGMLGICTLAFAVCMALTGDGIISAAVTLFIVVLLKGEASRRVIARESLFERQLAEALGLATRSLRAGHPLLSAFQLIVEEGEAPIRNVFAEIVQQQALGKSLEEAILTTAEQSHSSDLKLFAASTVIQLRSGGNVADMMDRLSDVIRDRIRLHRKVRVLTSQTQLSKKILIAVPFFLFAFLYLTRREYIEPLFVTDVGRILIAVAIVLLIIGNWMMNRIAVLKY